MTTENDRSPLPRESAPPGWLQDDPVPEGPVLVDSVLDEDVASLQELAERYPPPPGYGYALTEWGQPVVVHHDTGTRFSLLVEKRLLAFDWKVRTAQDTVFRTVEIERDSGEVFFPDEWPLSEASPSTTDTANTGDLPAPVPTPGPAPAPEPDLEEADEPYQTPAQKMLERVRSQFRYGHEWVHREDMSHYEGIDHALYEEPQHEAEIVAAVSTLLTDDNRLVRSGAVAVLPGLKERIGEDRLLEVLENHRDLYYKVRALGSRSAHYFPDLYSRLLCALGDVARPGNRRAVRILRAAAEEKFEAALSGLARLDPDWLCQNAGRLVPRENLLGLLQALPTPLHREQLVRALAPWKGRARKRALETDAWRFTPFEPAEIERLRSILAEGG